MLPSLNAAINLALAALLLVAAHRVRKCGLVPLYIFIILSVSAVGWILLYAAVLLADLHAYIDPVSLGQIFVRPLITLTLGGIIAALIHISRSC